MENQTKLQNWFAAIRSCVIGFSGGLDSTVLASAAKQFLGERAVCVMAVSPTSTEQEKMAAIQVAAAISVPLVILASDEMSDPRFVQNDANRCYYCKRIRFSSLKLYAQSEGFDVVLDGSHADDQHDYRPGKQALEELGVRSPFAELGMSKESIRDLARKWRLPNAEKPASPCLATRLTYQLEITEQRLRMIDEAERFLGSFGLSSFRVRLHQDSLARIEIAANEIDHFDNLEWRELVVKKFREIGFLFVTLDLEGFQSGSMNRLLKFS
ncbi:MAG: ATP-dependent sacrificial sulfur transferase LarE [Thermoguttaceae bacterium]